MNQEANNTDPSSHLIPANQPEQTETREEYSSPKLTEFGSIQKLTLGHSGSNCFLPPHFIRGL